MRKPHSSQAYLPPILRQPVFRNLARPAHRCGTLCPAQFRRMVQIARLERIVPEQIVPERRPQLDPNRDLKATQPLEHECNVVRQVHSVETQKALESRALNDSVQAHMSVVVPEMSARNPAPRVAAQNPGG